MKKRLLQLTLLLLCIVTQTQALTGTGTASDPFLISNSSDLFLFVEKTYKGETNICGKLTKSIDYNGRNGNRWIALGWSTKPYYGTFDGNGYTIKDMQNCNGDLYGWAFAYDNRGTIKNLTVEINAVSLDSVAGIAVKNRGTISNCIAKGTINGEEAIGGICALNKGTIENCQSSVLLTSTSNGKVGGIVGENFGTIRNCSNVGVVSATGSWSSHIGGIAGASASGTISNCYNQAAVTGIGYVGGIAGFGGSSEISNCYNTGNVSSTGRYDDKSNKVTYESFAGAVAGYYQYGNRMVNCHYLSTIKLLRSNKDTLLVGVGNGTAEKKTYGHAPEEFSGGLVCRLLNGGDGTTQKPSSMWGQSLGSSNFPFLNTTATYAVYCLNVGGTCYYGNKGQTFGIDQGYTCDKLKIYSVTNMDASGATYTSLTYTFGTSDYTLTPVKTLVEDMSNNTQTIDGKTFYKIATAQELKCFKHYVTEEGQNTANAILTADIDMSSVCGISLGNWHPIAGSYGGKPFAGIFDGAGHTVSKIYISMKDKYDRTVGNGSLFGFVSGTLKNVTVKDTYLYEDISYSGPSAVGLCYMLNAGGLITNCAVDGGSYTTVGSSEGGMVIRNNGTITHCLNNSLYSSDGIMGGIVSTNDTTGVVSSCVNTANLYFSNPGQQEFAGIAGHNSGIVENCINTGDLCSMYYRRAGIVSENGGIVRNCLNAGDLRSNYDSEGKYYGMIVYSNHKNGTVTHCYYRDDNKVLYKENPLKVTLKGFCENLNASATPDIRTFTSAQCSGGEAAWILNGSVAENTVWKQKLGTEANPSPLSAYTVFFINNIYTNTYIDASGTYLIYDAGGLKSFADKVNSGSNNGNLNAKLMADIDLSTVCSPSLGNWMPIADNAVGYSLYIGYSGTFDGNGKTISGLYLKTTSALDYVGLFSNVQTPGIIKNLTVDADISANYHCSAIVANNRGTISHCTAKGKIVSKGNSGGIAGVNFHNIEYCVNEASVSSSYTEKLGGITSENNGSISYCANKGTITNNGTSGENNGGITGSNFGTVSDCYNQASVTGSGRVGGIVGYFSRGTVANCYDIADVTSKASVDEHAAVTGAIAGYNGSGNITNCYYLDAVKLQNEGQSTLLMGVGDGQGEGDCNGRTSAEFGNGSITRLLNGGGGFEEKPAGAWGQMLGTDAYPVFMAEGNTNAVYNAQTYKGSSAVAAEGLMNLSYDAPTDNTMTMINDAGINTGILPANVITLEGTAKSIVLTDMKDFYLPITARSDAAIYTRSAFRDGHFETVSLPFPMSVLPEGYAFYQYTGNNGKTANFTPVTALEIGYPYLMKYTGTPSSEKAVITFSNSGGNVDVAEFFYDDTFAGSYVTVTNPSSTSYILGVYDGVDMFRKAGSQKLNPFRAYLNAPAGAKEMSIAFDDGTTGISTVRDASAAGDYYNLQGMKVSHPLKGSIYIHNGSKIMYR